MNSGEEEEESDEDESEEEVVHKKNLREKVGQIPQKSSIKASKAIAKQRRMAGKDRFKATGVRKNKQWIMKKKDRMRR